MGYSTSEKSGVRGCLKNRESRFFGFWLEAENPVRAWGRGWAGTGADWRPLCASAGPAQRGSAAHGASERCASRSWLKSRAGKSRLPLSFQPQKTQKSCRLKRLIEPLVGCKLDRGADLRLPGSARRGSSALAYREAFASLASASNSRRRGHLSGPARDRADRFDQHLRAAITISESGQRPVKGSVADWCRAASRIFPRRNSGENEENIWLYHATHGLRPRGLERRRSLASVRTRGAPSRCPASGRGPVDGRATRSCSRLSSVQAGFDGQ